MAVVASSLSAVAYKDLRDAIIANYLYVEIVDDNDKEITRLKIGGTDERAKWTQAYGANPLVLAIKLLGSDSDIPNPSTIAGLYLHKTAADTTRETESAAFTVFTVQSSDDSLNITGQIYLPAPTKIVTITADMIGQTFTVIDL